jgi:Outer membrane protein/protective antigen OMA87
MKRRYTLAIVILGVTFSSIYGLNIDSLLNRFPSLNFYFIPTFSHQKETGNQFGLNGGYYFRFIDSTRISNLSFSQTFTQRQQYSVSLSPRLYLGGGGKWTVSGNISAQNYPTSFLGIGNNRRQLLPTPIAYTSRNYSFYFQFQRFLDKHISMGLHVALRSEKPVVDDSLKFKAMGIHVTGWKPYFLLGLGGVVTYDSRNDLFYPMKGILGSASLVHYNPIWGSTYNIVQINLDFRQYIALYKQHVFAWQFVTDWRLGNAIPFQMLTTIGGNQLLRGVPGDLFRDNVMAALQAEYRFPIYKVLRGAVFASSGDVMNSNNLMIHRLKTSYGAGIRFKITRGKMNVSGRWDITHTNVDKGFQFFMTALEAF